MSEPDPKKTAHPTIVRVMCVKNRVTPFDAWLPYLTH